MASAPPLRQRLVDSALLSGVADVASRALTVLLSIVAARVVGPTDVGTLGVAVSLVTIVSVAGYFWETAGVVAGEADDAPRQALAAAALRVVFISTVLAVLAWLRPWLSARLSSSPAVAARLSGLLGILASTLLIEAAACYPRILLLRQLNQRVLAWLQLVAVAVFVGGSLLLLQQGWGIVGIAWAQVVSSLVSAVLAWRLVPFPGTPLPGREVFRTVAVHTGRLFVGGFSGFLATRIDNVLVAGTIGETGMSFYSMAYNASRLPINVLERVTSFVLAPALAQIRGEPARVQEAVNQTLRHLYLLVAPVATLLFVCAPTLTAVVLGERWAPLAAPLRVMSLVAIAAPTLHATAAVLVSHGRAHWIAAPGAALLLFQVLAIPPMARHFGPIGAAGVDLAATLLVTWAMCHAARRAVAGVSWRPLGFLRLPALAAAAAGTLAWSAGLQAPGCVARLALQLGLIAAGYPALVWLLGGATLLKELAVLVRGRAPGVPTA